MPKTRQQLRATYEQDVTRMSDEKLFTIIQANPDEYRKCDRLGLDVVQEIAHAELRRRGHTLPFLSAILSGVL